MAEVRTPHIEHSHRTILLYIKFLSTTRSDADTKTNDAEQNGIRQPQVTAMI